MERNQTATLMLRKRVHSISSIGGKLLVTKILIAIMIMLAMTGVQPLQSQAIVHDVSSWAGFISTFDMLKATGGDIIFTSDITAPSGGQKTFAVTAEGVTVRIHTDGHILVVKGSRITFGTGVDFYGGTTKAILGVTYGGEYNGSIVINGANLEQPEGNLNPAVEVANKGTLEMLAGTITGRGNTVMLYDGGNALIKGGVISSIGTGASGVYVAEGADLVVSGEGTRISVEGINSNGISSSGNVTLNGNPIIDGRTSSSRGIYLSALGELVMNGGLVQSQGIGLLNMGNTAEIRSGEINGEVYGISSRGTTSIWDGTISGGNYGVFVQGTFIQYAGSITGENTALYLAENAHATVYTGSLEAGAANRPVVTLKAGLDPTFIYFTAVSWNESVQKSDTQFKVYKRKSFDVLSPDQIELEPGTEVVVPFTIQGQRAIGGSIFTLADLLGSGGTMNIGGMNNLDYTVSGNQVVFTPLAIGSGFLSIEDLMTYTGVTKIPVTVANPVVVKPSATPAGGTYSSPVSVVLTATTVDSNIHYTIDGSTPTEASTPYTLPIALSENTVLKAVAVKNHAHSDMMTETYQFSVSVPGTPSMSNLHKTRTYTRGQFADVNEASWYGYDHQKVVADAYEFGLMQGVGTAGFAPNGQVTLAEAITMAARIHSIYQTGSDTFVQGVPWYQVYVDYAIFNGIIQSTDFPNYTRAATRAELAYIFSKALPVSEFTQQNTVHQLPDVNSGTAYSSSIILLYQAGVLTGSDAEGTFNPTLSITRAEAAAIISRVAQPMKRASGKIYGL